MTTEDRTLVVTITAGGLTDEAWRDVKRLVNEKVDRVLHTHCRDGASIARRSDDIGLLLDGGEL